MLPILIPLDKIYPKSVVTTSEIGFAGTGDINSFTGSKVGVNCWAGTSFGVLPV